VFEGKKVLVAGGTGMIGRQLVDLLIQAGARVRIASLDDASRAHAEAEFIQADLMLFENCAAVCEGMEFVFNLLGVKGSPAVARAKPATFFVPTIILDTNLMEAAWQARVDGFLFTSSIAVYAPSETLHEEDVWKTFPSENDRFPGWAKRMGELQAETYRIQYGWERICIVRPSNVYGPYDNFELENSMVVPSLIKRTIEGENPLMVWGDGSAERDFIHARDVARGMILAAEQMPGEPINLGSGVGVSIRRLVEIIVGNLEKAPEVQWDIAKPTGDKRRVMGISRARAIGFEPSVSLEQGIREVMAWYRERKDRLPRRYDVFESATRRET